uniref:Uncharacterized protein n=1 Tax=Panagrolaimus sp. JU765 TaxID=591449 RepID=A0AC34Q718_9BILA
MNTGSGFGISDQARIVDTSDDDDGIMRRNISKYDNFTTIDWTKELAKDRSRRKEKLINKNKSILSWLAFWLESGSAWGCVMLVGLFTGILAAVVDIGDGWLTDLKFGLCTTNIWLNREHCCLNSLNSNCTNWQRWTTIFGTKNGSFLYFLIDFFIYTTSAVSMALLAGFLVLVFAPYAAGSGIAEIKCILSGFVIRKFLGISTLWVKTVGIILASSSGLALGKEGPAVHLACCIGNIVTRWFPKYKKNEAKKREVLSASAAAALSVAFGAPIGGVMFRALRLA